MDPQRITHDLAKALTHLRFGKPVTHVYNPLIYAADPHRAYVACYGMRTRRPVLLVGMNPGPWGMAQTGVPFGDLPHVRDWLGISGRVDVPPELHPKRPVVGYACTRREVSGSRLWGWGQARFGTAERFFDTFFVVNYCPLIFFEADGKNRTPDKLPREERNALFHACDQALQRWVAHLQPQFVVGVGAFAEGRIVEALQGDSSMGAATRVIGRISHPSPASPVANRGWAAQIEKELRQMGVPLDDAGKGSTGVNRRRSVG